MIGALPVFVGYDSREADAAAVCVSSLQRHASRPLLVQYLHEPALRHAGVYWRKWRSAGAGQKVDAVDGKPFSTAFSFTRFLVPTLMQHRGVALFVDCDFLFLSDVAKLFALFDPAYAVQVVKHEFTPPDGIKMDGQAQQPYWRKNWSSCILWNCSHPANQRIIPHRVNTEPGQWLHGFSWLDDHEIGEIPLSWNWLAGVSEPLARGRPDAVHFTLGVPSMAGYEDAPYADEWRAEIKRSAG